MEKNIEFEEMKQQLQQLQQRIDKQVEINEKKALSAIKESAGDIHHQDLRSTILCIIVAVIVPIILYAQGFPLHFVSGTFVFLLLNAVWRYFLRFDHSALTTTSLVETSKRLLKYKKDERNSTFFIGLPLAICWVIWFLFEQSKILPTMDSEALIFSYIVVAIGGIVGFAIGMKLFYLPKMRAIDRLLRQIEELQEEI